MQECRRRARAAVEYKCQGSGGLAVFGDISGIKNRRALLARLIIKRESARGRRVSKRAARRIDGVFGDGVRRQQPQHAFFGGAALGNTGLRSLISRCVFLRVQHHSAGTMWEKREAFVRTAAPVKITPRICRPRGYQLAPAAEIRAPLLRSR